jgi:hypothetical protein
MTQPTLDFTPSADTFTGRVAHLFRSRPDTWIDGLEIAHVGGAYAWRTRLSECRSQFGMVIENRQRRVGRRVVSEYRLCVDRKETEA